MPERRPRLRGGQAGPRAEPRALGARARGPLLIHWPVPLHDKYVETWRAFIDLQEEGLARSIGVSNFQPAHLERLIAATGVIPAVNQVELHPRFQQGGLRREHARLGIVTEAWSPLARGGCSRTRRSCGSPTRHGKTPAQVVIRWHLQLGNVVIPKSVTPERIAENFDVFNFLLAPGEMAAIDELDAGERTAPTRRPSSGPRLALG